ncbi:MAG: DUF3515 domain-containing protein [Pontimonas sp.]|nr:DUF3515 domain-containing protein [Pontimonas sp.]MDP4972056.1 DUF3515 domain-containing protein [Pontimonas sp.]MDP5128539.1 DUF3515 domain-containing protein [Pontimonas sp.]
MRASSIARAWLILVGASILGGCAPTVALEPAVNANTPECANMMVRLPDTVAELPRRNVNAQSTAAWGEPVAVIVRCGLPTPPPSTLPCATVEGIDWLRDDSDAPSFVFTTYGLDPATEVIVDSAVVSGTSVLRDIARAVGSQSTPIGQCLDPASVLD